MSGKPSRDKGARFERQIVQAFEGAGICAERVPLSGAAQGSFAGDVLTTWLGKNRKIECKKRARGFKFIYDNLEGNDALVVGADRKPPVVCMELGAFLDVLRHVNWYMQHSGRLQDNIAALIRDRVSAE